jgi:hypothetical protein
MTRAFVAELMARQWRNPICAIDEVRLRINQWRNLRAISFIPTAH